MRRKLVAFSVVVAIAAGIGFYAAGNPAPVQSYAKVRADYRTSEKQLLDRHGEVLHELRVDATRRRLGWTAIADISPVTLEAVVRAEDRRFFAHRGVDWRAGAGALWNALRGGRRRGASTITMQLAADLDRGLRARSRGRDLGQKWAQMRAAFVLEAGWDKHRILEAYLNLVSFRGELQGIAAASRGLFGKTPAGLDAAESWLLAALLGAPNATANRVARRACRLAGAAGDPGVCHRLAALTQTALHRSPHLPPGVALAPHVARRLLTDPEGIYAAPTERCRAIARQRCARANPRRACAEPRRERGAGPESCPLPLAGRRGSRGPNRRMADRLHPRRGSPAPRPGGAAPSAPPAPGSQCAPRCGAGRGQRERRGPGLRRKSR